MFLEKLRAQGWIELFGNAKMGCSSPDLAEFYANCSVTQGVVTSVVGGTQIRFDAVRLGEILGVPTVGCTDYVREDKSVLDQAQLLDMARRLGQQPDLTKPKSLRKGDMTPIHQLLFWFVIKNIIPRGQGRNLADAMDQHLVDLLARGEPINLPAIMIRHIHRIATSTRDHDLGYGFFLTQVLEQFGVLLQRRIGAQMVDLIGSTTLLGCGFKSGPGGTVVPEQGSQTPFTPVPGTSSSAPPVDLLQELTRQKAEIAQLKTALDEERALHVKRHGEILSLFSTLTAKLSNLPP